MKKRAAIMAATALTTIGVVTLVLYQERFEEQVSGGELIGILVAAQDIPLGTVLAEDMVGIRDVPESYVDARQIPAAEAHRVMGLRVTSAVRTNESVVWTDLARAEERRDLSGLIPDGLRGFTIHTDATSSFGGLLRPGDRVDVLLTAQRGGGYETAPIAQNLLVLAAGRDIGARTGLASGRHRDEVSQVTLSVTLAHSQILALAQQQGDIHLVLRNPDDIQVAQRPPTQTSRQLMEALRTGALSEAP